jgi:hypothetical protein
MRRLTSFLLEGRGERLGDRVPLDARLSRAEPRPRRSRIRAEGCELFTRYQAIVGDGRRGQKRSASEGSGAGDVGRDSVLIAGTLSIIYGVAAVSNAHFFDNTHYVFLSLHTWGWITIVGA